MIDGYDVIFVIHVENDFQKLSRRTRIVVIAVKGDFSSENESAGSIEDNNVTRFLLLAAYLNQT